MSLVMRSKGRFYPRVTRGNFVDVDVPAEVRWSALGNEANFIIKGLLQEWRKLLNQTRRAEAACHKFLAENAGVFWQWDQSFPAVISKVRLGAELITDFVVVENCYSNGAKYHLFELESPADPLFTQKGIASQPLLSAIHQVISWKTWIQEHRAEARRLFPSLMHWYDIEPIFSYNIVIGRRTKEPELIRRRRELSMSLGVGIRSFDSLADHILKRPLADTATAVFGDEDPSMDDVDISELINPFRSALSDPEWRQLIRGMPDVGHFYHAVGVKYQGMGKRSRKLIAFRRWARQFVAARRPKTIE